MLIAYFWPFCLVPVRMKLYKNPNKVFFNKNIKPSSNSNRFLPSCKKSRKSGDRFSSGRKDDWRRSGKILITPTLLQPLQLFSPKCTEGGFFSVIVQRFSFPTIPNLHAWNLVPGWPLFSANSVRLTVDVWKWSENHWKNGKKRDKKLSQYG